MENNITIFAGVRDNNLELLKNKKQVKGNSDVAKAMLELRLMSSSTKALWNALPEDIRIEAVKNTFTEDVEDWIKSVKDSSFSSDSESIKDVCDAQSQLIYDHASKEWWLFEIPECEGVYAILNMGQYWSLETWEEYLIRIAKALNPNVTTLNIALHNGDCTETKMEKKYFEEGNITVNLIPYSHTTGNMPYQLLCSSPNEAGNIHRYFG